LWPDVIRAAVQSPKSILVDQAEALKKQTNGVLVGMVNSGATDDDQALLYFSILVPELNDYRHRIMVVQHKKGMEYPTTIDAEVFRPSGIIAIHQALGALAALHEEARKPNNRADNDREFIELVKKVLQSPYVVSVAQSLIARANDVRAGKKVDPISSEIDSSSTNGTEGSPEAAPGDC
jgi:hypothetical protein